MHDLSGKTVLLTGASKGIGAATAMALCRAGASLVAHYGTDRAGAEAAVAGLPPERVLLLQADLGQTPEVDRLWREALAWRGWAWMNERPALYRLALALARPLRSLMPGWQGGWTAHRTPLRLALRALRDRLKDG